MKNDKSKKCIVSEHARMWPRAIFAPVAATHNHASSLELLKKSGIYILYRDDIPFYIGKADILWKRLRTMRGKLRDHTITSGISSQHLR